MEAFWNSVHMTFADCYKNQRLGEPWRFVEFKEKLLLLVVDDKRQSVTERIANHEAKN